MTVSVGDAAVDAGCDLDGYPVRGRPDGMVFKTPDEMEALARIVCQDVACLGLSGQNHANLLTDEQISNYLQSSPFGRNDHLVQSCVQLAPQHWDDLNKYVPSPSARIADLEAENVHLRALLNRIAPERLSAGWEHLPDVAAPPVRTMPARALRGGDGVPR